MNLDGIETLLVSQLRSVLPREAEVRPGPMSTPPLGGMRATVFVHGARFEDMGGVTHEGARTGRRLVRVARRTGIAEERPGRIVIEVVCIATAYATVKAMNQVISSAVLLGLNSKREFPVGALANKSVLLSFSDLNASLNRAETFVKEEKDLRYHCGRLVFHLEGFLHVLITKRGGLRASTSSAPMTEVVAKAKTAKSKKTKREREKKTSQRRL